MRKIQVTIPVFKEVQVSEEYEDRWITSDGKEFGKEETAIVHERIKVEMKERLPLFPEVEAILDVKSIDDIEFYIKHSFSRFNAGEIVFNLEQKMLPGRVVFYRVEKEINENKELRFETKLYCAGIDEYKKIMKDILEKL